MDVTDLKQKVKSQAKLYEDLQMELSLKNKRKEREELLEKYHDMEKQIAKNKTILDSNEKLQSLKNQLSVLNDKKTELMNKYRIKNDELSTEKLHKSWHSIDHLKVNSDLVFALFGILNCFKVAFQKDDRTTGFWGKVYNFIISAGWFLGGLLGMATVVMPLLGGIVLLYHQALKLVHTSNEKALIKELDKINKQLYDELQVSIDDVKSQINDIERPYNRLIAERGLLKNKLKTIKQEIEKLLNTKSKDTKTENKKHISDEYSL